MPAPRLVDRVPVVSPDELIDAMVPPPRFDAVRLATYLPDPTQPSQRAAVAACEAFAERVAAGQARQSWLGALLGRKRDPGSMPGLYLDGGFGVGKTHLLASM